MCSDMKLFKFQMEYRGLVQIDFKGHVTMKSKRFSL